MIKPLSRGSALLLSGSALALTGAILPAQAATPGVAAANAATTGWRTGATFAVKGREVVLTSIDAVSARDAWAAGLSASSKGTSVQTVIRHWNGKTWASVTLPAKIATAWQKAGGFEGQVGALSPTDVWIFGSRSGAYLRVNGKHWSVGKLPGGSSSSGKDVEITAVKAFSNTDVWAFGTTVDLTNINAKSVPYAAQYNGHKWTTQKVPGTGVITAVSAASSRSIWAVIGSADDSAPLGGTGQPSVAHWGPAAGWTQPAQPVLPAGANLTSVLAEQGGNVLVGGAAPNSHKGTTPLAATWNGKSWTVANLPGPSSATWTLTSLAPDGHGVWAVALASNRQSARLWHLAGTTWSIVTPDFGKHAWILEQLAAVPHTSSVWGAGALQQGSGAEGLIAVAGPAPH
jgi:hypothetical protein